jgi:WD40 repeat protein
MLVKVHERGVSDLAVSTDGRWLATADSISGKAFLWRLDMIKPEAAPVELRGHAGPVTTVRFSPGNRWLATGSEDKTARLWNLSGRASSENAVVLKGSEDSVEGLTFSPDSRWLATSNYNFHNAFIHSREFSSG